jgi:hypothetical protein
MPIRQGGILASRASTWPRDHFCRSTMPPRVSWPTTWNEFLPISGRSRRSRYWVSETWRAPCLGAPGQLSLAGQEHGRTIPLPDVGDHQIFRSGSPPGHRAGVGGELPCRVLIAGIGTKRRQFYWLGRWCGRWPPLAQAQRAEKVIGFLSSRSAADSNAVLATFVKGVGETGLVESRDFKIEYRWANGNFDALPNLVNELVAKRVSLIAAAGGPYVTLSEIADADALARNRNRQPRILTSTRPGRQISNG